MPIYKVSALNLSLITEKLDTILKQYLNQLDNPDMKYGLLSISKNNEKILINTALAGDLVISYIYRQLQYGYPLCLSMSPDLEKCKRSKDAKLEFIYITVAALDEVLWSKPVKREMLYSILSNIVENRDNFALLESIKVFLAWFLESYRDKEKSKIMTEKLGSLNDDYVTSLLKNILKRIENKDKEIDNIIEAKLKIGGIDRYIHNAINEEDIDKLLEVALIGLAFDGFTWLKPLIYELMALYVYIANNYRILPFGAMQHVIEGGYTWSVTLGDFIDPETNSLIDVKSSPYAVRSEALIRLSFELRMPIHIAVPHYLKKENNIDTSTVYLSVYKPKYRGGKKLQLVQYKRMKAHVLEHLHRIRPRIMSLWYTT